MRYQLGEISHSALFLVFLLTMMLTATATAQQPELTYQSSTNMWVASGQDAAPPASAAPAIKGRSGGNVDGTMTIVTSFPFPSGWAFGRDMAWDGTSLWVAENYSSRIFEVDPSNGTVLSDFGAPTSNPWGLTFDGTNLINAERDSAAAPEPDDAFVVTTTGTILLSWPLPDSPDAEVRGSAYDSGTGSLWLSDAGTDTIYQTDPSDGTVLSSFAAPGTEMRGLAFAGGDIWGIDYTTLTLIRFTTTGTVVDTFDISSLGNIPEGLTCDGQYMWVTENETGTIYQIDVGPVPVELMELAIE